MNVGGASVEKQMHGHLTVTHRTLFAAPYIPSKHKSTGWLYRCVKWGSEQSMPTSQQLIDDTPTNSD